MKPEIIFQTDNVDKIYITVALPALNAKNIIWLALESLVRQTLDEDVYWELIICEEYGISIDIIKEYIDKLKDSHCSRLVYVNIDPNKFGIYKNKFLLIEKWVYSANIASLTSKIYALMACDDYMHPKRLQIHYDHFKDKNCIMSCHPMAAFYNLNNGKMFLYDGKLKDKMQIDNMQTHPSMAFRTTDIKRINIKILFFNIDSYIFREIKKIHGINFKKNNIFYHTGNEWKNGFFTDGMNSISQYRTAFYDKNSKDVIFDYNAFDNNKLDKLIGRAFFCNPINDYISKRYDYTYIDDYIPRDVFDALLKIKN